MIENDLLNYIFGGVILTAIGTSFAIITNFLNLKDRIKKVLEKRNKAKFKSKFYENNPDFKFSLNILSNPEFGKCILNSSILNVSKEIKYFDSFEYRYEDPKNLTKLEPSKIFMNGEIWPRRLEHGERYNSSVDFTSTLFNDAFHYWKKGFKVYCISKTSTGDYLRSNSIGFDKLMDFLEPISDEYKILAISLTNKFESSLPEIEISLWQLQKFNRLTVHIAKQLHYNKIPIVEYLVKDHGLVIKQDIWFHWYRDLEEKKIRPQVIKDFLQTLI